MGSEPPVEELLPEHFAGVLAAYERHLRAERDLSRHTVRAEFEARFTASRMAADYVEAYNQLIHRRPASKFSLVAAE